MKHIFPTNSLAGHISFSTKNAIVTCADLCWCWERAKVIFEEVICPFSNCFLTAARPPGTVQDLFFSEIWNDKIRPIVMHLQ